MDSSGSRPGARSLPPFSPSSERPLRKCCRVFSKIRGGKGGSVSVCVTDAPLSHWTCINNCHGKGLWQNSNCGKMSQVQMLANFPERELPESLFEAQLLESLPEKDHYPTSAGPVLFWLLAATCLVGWDKMVATVSDSLLVPHRRGLKADRGREELQTHGREKSTWELSLKYSFSLLFNIASLSVMTQ